MADAVEQAVGTCEVSVELTDDATGLKFRDRRRFATLEAAADAYDRMVRELTEGLSDAG
jgi:hypothetical protein